MYCTCDIYNILYGFPATSGARNAYTFRAPGFTHVAKSLVVCRSLFALFHLAIALSVLRFTASEYISVIFKLLNQGTYFPTCMGIDGLGI